MPERTYRGVDIDLDDLADAVVDWFEHDGFEVQDFLEGPAIFIQARRRNLVTALTVSSQALNVRLSPLSSGFKIQVGAGEWLDKGVGAAATLALRFLNPWVALGTGLATGYGIYQQFRLPEQLLDFVEMYVERNGAPRDERELEPRRERRSRAREAEVDSEIEALKRTGQPGGGAGYCGKCGASLRGGDRFCAGCGAKVPGPAPAEPAESDASDSDDA